MLPNMQTSIATVTTCMSCAQQLQLRTFGVSESHAIYPLLIKQECMLHALSDNELPLTQSLHW